VRENTAQAFVDDALDYTDDIQDPEALEVFAQWPCLTDPRLFEQFLDSHEFLTQDPVHSCGRATSSRYA
jgi:hypothetical protein